MDVFDLCINVGLSILNEPEEFLPFCDEALIHAQSNLTKLHNNSALYIKKFCCIRFFNVPPIDKYWKRSVREIRCCDIGSFIAVNGTVIRTGPVKLLEARQQLRCTLCLNTFRHESASPDSNISPKVVACPSKVGGRKCKGKDFETVEGTRVCRDTQTIRIQERFDTAGASVIPRTLDLDLSDDLVDSVQAGDTIVVFGPLFSKWDNSLPPKIPRGTLLELNWKLKVLHISKENDDTRTGSCGLAPENLAKYRDFWSTDHSIRKRDTILSSFCPQLHGMYLAKLAVLVCLAGGSKDTSKTDEGATRTRTQPHLLIVGDSGMGKSQLLRFASKIVRRSVMTTGSGTSSAGLTVAAVREGAGWALEAGALVLADGGLCCIDELASVQKSDQGAIHEAMEQQTISVAKAGMVCTLNSRCSVIGAMNPASSFDPELDISQNCAIASPLLSRFDMIVILVDSKNSEWDKSVCSHILSSRHSGEETFWSIDELADYMETIKRLLNPKLDEVSQMVITKYYQLQRQSDQRNAARTTIRLLESLVRISQGHARLMFRDKVVLQDAIIAVILMEASLINSHLLKASPLQLWEFPENPDATYKQFESKILEKLSIQVDI